MAEVKVTSARSATDQARDYLEDRLGTADDSQSLKAFTIPVIDIASSYSGSLKDRKEVSQQIREACVSSGFFYVKSHNITPQASRDILAHSKRFFHTLAADQKNALHISKSKYGYGWEPADATSIYGDAEQKEAFNWGYEADLDPEARDNHSHVQLDGTKSNEVNQWPAETALSGFRNAIKTYHQQVLTLARHLYKLLALSLDLPENYFNPMITDPSVTGRLMYYPPAPAKKEPRQPLSDDDDKDDLTIGLGAHSDYQCFTILLLDSSTTPGGLEILSPTTGAWIQALAIPDTLIVNIGDMMMRWTNGLYQSTVHRVVRNISAEEERFSVPVFFGVDNDQVVEVGCLIDSFFLRLLMLEGWRGVVLSCFFLFFFFFSLSETDNCDRLYQVASQPQVLQSTLLLKLASISCNV